METKSTIIEIKLQKLLGKNATTNRRKIKEGSCDGDTKNTWAFDVKFIDWQIQNNKNRKGVILDNCDYWMPKIRKILNVSETYWFNSNLATMWFYKEQI